MKILVTGGDGQLGCSLRLASAKSSHRYIFTNIDELDITNKVDVAKFLREEGVEVVVNCAAYTAVDAAEEDEANADKINHRAVAIVAEACREQGATLIHISTDYIFSGDASMPYTEQSEAAPRTVYGRTKLAGERAIAESGCRHIVLRTAWLYSEFGRNFVKRMRELTSTKSQISVVADQRGTPTYAGDLAEAIVEIIESNKLSKYGTFHYTNLGETTWYDFAAEIARLSGNSGCTISPCATADYPTKAQRPHYSVLDKSRFIEAFGIAIPQWQESLAKCIERLKRE